MARKLRWSRLIGVTLGSCIVAAAGLGYHLYRTAGQALASNASNPGDFNGRVTILVLGEGLVENGNTDITNPNVPDQSDTMMLVSIDPKTDQASVLSIPRDSMINLPQAGGLNKINDANYVGGPKLAVKVVEQTLNTPVDYYVETTIFNFAKIIDAIGGLTVDVPKAMNYGSATGKFSYLNIHLNPGVQHLNGQQVLEFVRFREEALGDIGRIQQQQYVVSLILHKVLQPGEISKLPQVISMLRQDITATNLTTQQMVELGLLGTHLNLSQVRYSTLPGHPVTIKGIDYWSLDQRLIPVIRDDILLGHLKAQDRSQIHIVVRSGTDSLQPAQKVAQWLQQQGFSVGSVIWANQHNHVTTTVQDYTGDKYLAGQILNALGGKSTGSVQEVAYHDVSGVDMVITVGQDLNLNPKAKI